jgi:phosphonate transport system substrate-binding protein
MPPRSVDAMRRERGSSGRGQWSWSCQPLLVFLAALLVSCGRELPQVDMTRVNPHQRQASEDSRPTLRVAVGAMISPQRTRRLYDELLSLVAEQTGRRAVCSQRRTYAELNSMVEAREVDVALVCSGPYTLGQEEFGMELLVVPVVDGKTVYHSLIIVHEDSEISNFDELEGRRFAFTDPDSNTGCLVPTYMLAQRGQTPATFFGSTFFTHSHDNSIRAVAEHRADAAAVDSLIWKYMDSLDPGQTSRTRVIVHSPPYGIPPVVVHPALESDLKARLREIFLSLHEDPRAAPLLERLRIDRFEPGVDSDYDSVREMRRWTKSSGGR